MKKKKTYESPRMTRVTQKLTCQLLNASVTQAQRNNYGEANSLDNSVNRTGYGSEFSLDNSINRNDYGSAISLDN